MVLPDECKRHSLLNNFSAKFNSNEHVVAHISFFDPGDFPFSHKFLVRVLLGLRLLLYNIGLFLIFLLHDRVVLLHLFGFLFFSQLHLPLHILITHCEQRTVFIWFGLINEQIY